MKLLLVIVSLIVAFKADGRHFSDDPTIQESTPEKTSFPEEPSNSDFTDTDYYISFEHGTESPESNEGSQNRYDTGPAPPVDENELDEITLRGKGDKKNLQKLIKSFDSLKYNLTQDNLKIKMELQSIKDYQINITNADKELKMDLNSAMENITKGDLKLKTELQNANSGLKTDVASLKSSINSYNSNILSKLNANSGLKTDVASLKSSIISYNSNILSKLNANSGLKTDVASLKSSINSYNSNILSKLNAIAVKQGQGYLKHFPYASNKKTWMDAKAHCESIGGQIWTPVNREDTVNAYKACGTLCWNGWHKNGQGQWVTGNGELKNSNFWAPNEPDTGEDAVWSSSGGLYARKKTNRYGWTCQM